MPAREHSNFLSLSNSSSILVIGPSSAVFAQRCVSAEIRYYTGEINFKSALKIKSVKFLSLAFCYLPYLRKSNFDYVQVFNSSDCSVI